MIVKNTYSLSIVWAPQTEGNTTKQIASSGREVTAMGLVASGGAATIELYDGSTDNYANLRWVLDSSTQDTDRVAFTYPLFFKNGIYAKLTQGSNFNPILNIAIIPDQV